MYDIAIIGGGVNGCGIARDAAGRGYSVFLAEQGDLASGTSSGATKLIHGGLRYLEHFAFRLVRESLAEREVLWGIAPHLIRPMRFVLPHHAGMRPWWMLRAGLFLYDHIGGRRKLAGTRSLDLRRDPAGGPLREDFCFAFEYSDCWVDDARLVVLNAQDAADRGAVIRPRTAVVETLRVGDGWRVRLSDGTEVVARVLINAAGPWIDQVLGAAFGRNDAANVRLVQGSHIVVRRRLADERAYLFQNSDGRVLFAIPYEHEFVLIGTTDRDFSGDPGDAAISEDEIDYLCTAASAYLREPVTRDEIVWTFAAVRPLYDDGANAAKDATRDYVLRLEQPEGEAALLNVFGGKLTTYRRLAGEAVDHIVGVLGPRDGAQENWTATVPLPGGDFPPGDVERLAGELAARHAFLDAANALRLVRAYGTLAFAMLEDRDPGYDFGHGLFEREVSHLVAREWAVTAEDILWRRTKLGLRFNDAEVDALVTRLAL